jgi:hypothetical protein
MRKDNRPAYERVLERVTVSGNGCWLCSFSTNGVGYPQIRVDGVLLYVHREIYKHYIGDPGNLRVCHGCDTPECCNPLHMFLGTQADNMADMRSKGRGCEVLNENEIAAMLLCWNIGVCTKTLLAEKFSVSRRTVLRVVGSRERLVRT